MKIPYLDLRKTGVADFIQFADELERLYQSNFQGDFDSYLDLYNKSKTLRRCWGTPYPYFCFIRQDGT